MHLSLSPPPNNSLPRTSKQQKEAHPLENSFNSSIFRALNHGDERITTLGQEGRETGSQEGRWGEHGGSQVIHSFASKRPIPLKRKTAAAAPIITLALIFTGKPVIVASLDRYLWACSCPPAPRWRARVDNLSLSRILMMVTQHQQQQKGRAQLFYSSRPSIAWNMLPGCVCLGEYTRYMLKYHPQYISHGIAIYILQCRRIIITIIIHNFL